MLAPVRGLEPDIRVVPRLKREIGLRILLLVVLTGADGSWPSAVDPGHRGTVWVRLRAWNITSVRWYCKYGIS
jgi:hypothetical protein